MTGPLVELEELERRLAAADLELPGSEVHGLLSGLLCGRRQDAEAVLLAELFPRPAEGDLLFRECRRTLGRLLDQTAAALADPGLRFAPLLPTDETPILQRAAAVVAWCRGFLYGIGIAGHATEQSLSEQTREALHDIGEITRMDLEGLGDGDEEEESSLMQITEFLWVAAVLVYEDLSRDRSGG